LELPVVHIELENGWADAYRERLRITARLHQAEMKRCMVPVDDETYKDGKAELSKLQELEVMPKPKFLVDTTLLDNDVINEIYILYQVRQWSFGPVDKQTLDYGLTDTQYAQLVRELDALYKPIPLA
jgi:hypothetical protein